MKTSSSDCRPVRKGYRLLALVLGACSLIPPGGGCATIREKFGTRPPGTMGQEGGRTLIGPEELDQLTRAFADRYVGLMSSTCDVLKHDNTDLVQRREAQVWLLNSANNVYDIASNADAFTRLLDLVVVTTLSSRVWGDDGRAARVFGDERGAVLVRALEHGRAETWALAGRVLDARQLAMLEQLVLAWRRDNPETLRVASVRFSNFAVGRGTSAAAEVLAARGWFANVGKAGKSVDEARLLTERMFYWVKRQPTLLRWEVEAMKDSLLATPEVGTFATDVHRLTDQAARLPSDVAAERTAIVAALDQHIASVDATVGGVRSALREAGEMSASVDAAGRSLDSMLKSAEGVLARYDALASGPDAAPARTFDVREYTEGVKELAAALQNMNDVLVSSDALLASSDWGRRMEDLNQSADARMKVAAEQSQRVVTAGFRQLWATGAALFVLLVLYQLARNYLGRRLAAGAPSAPAGLAYGNGDAADLKVSRPHAATVASGVAHNGADIA
jgi:hypothetical protein